MKKNLILFCILVFFPFFVSAKEQLIIEPDMGRAPILAAILQAKISLNLVMYGFTDDILLNGVGQAKKNIASVRILLEPHPYKCEDENCATMDYMHATHVNLQVADPHFELTHQKTLIIDNNHAIIMTCNFTDSTFRNERNFALVITDPLEIREIQNVFDADWKRSTVAVNHPNLLWSPNNSRSRLLRFIKDAKSDINIYAQSLTDYETIGALAKAAKSGVDVKILTSAQTMDNAFNYLTQAGVKIHFSKNYIIHAKVIIADHSRALLGSMNLTKPSIEENRELSVISGDPETVNTLEKTFVEDWKNSSTTPENLYKKVPHFAYAYHHRKHHRRHRWLS